MNTGAKEGKRSKRGQKGLDSCHCSRNTEEVCSQDVTEMSGKRIFD